MVGAEELGALLKTIRLVSFKEQTFLTSRQDYGDGLCQWYRDGVLESNSYRQCHVRF